MRIEIKDLKLEDVASLPVGTFVRVLNKLAAPMQTYLIASGGGEVDAKFMVTLTGPDMFKGIRLNGTTAIFGVRLPVDQVFLKLDGATTEPPASCKGLVIDDDGAYLGVDWSVGPNPHFNYLHIATSTFSSGYMKNQAWPGKWELVTVDSFGAETILASSSAANS